MPLWTSSVIVLVVSLGAFAPPALAQSGAVASAILDVKPVVFPVYDAYKGI